MKMMYVYILECADGSYYTGVTNNTEIRLAQHNEGIDKNCYTYERRPVKMVFCERYTDPLQAIAFEKKIKGWTRKKKEALINEQWDLLPELSKNKQGNALLRQAQDDNAQKLKNKKYENI